MPNYRGTQNAALNSLKWLWNFILQDFGAVSQSLHIIECFSKKKKKKTSGISLCCSERDNADLSRSILNITAALWTREVHYKKQIKKPQENSYISLLFLLLLRGWQWCNKVRSLPSAAECLVEVFGGGLARFKGRVVSELSNLCTHSIINGRR